MKRLVVMLLLAAALLMLVVRSTDLDAATLRSVLSGMSVPHVLGAFGIYGVSYLGRALRLKWLLRSDAGWLHLASISARHNFFNALLPFRSGEAALPLMLKAEAGHPLSEGAAMLFVCRVLDLLSVTAWLLLGLTWRRSISADASSSFNPALGVLALVILMVALMRPLALRCASLVGTDGRWRRFVHDAGRRLGAVSAGQLFIAAGMSLVTWLCTYLACWWLVLAMASPLAPVGTGAPLDPLELGHSVGVQNSVGAALAAVDFPTSLVGTTGLHLTAILPVNTPAGLGAWEAGWTAGYTLAGVDRLAAAASAVGSHLMIFAFITVLGLLALLLRPTPLRPGPREHSLW